MVSVNAATTDGPAHLPESVHLGRLAVDVVLVTGMSGAGRSTVARMLEDLGFYVVDNLPPQLLLDLVQVASATKDPRGDGALTRIAAVVDVRAIEFSVSFNEAVTAMRQRGWVPNIIFLDANNETLVRRFESVRRPHPLQRDGLLLDGIMAERALLEDLRPTASVFLDTTGLNVHQLTRKVTAMFAGERQAGLRLAVMSFGFKYGVPLDADFVFDMRFLPNPFWVPELRTLTGVDALVAEFVLGAPGARAFLDAMTTLMAPVTAGYHSEERRHVTIAVGCTGGKHRSVAMAEAAALALRSDDVSTYVVHRDLGRE